MVVAFLNTIQAAHVSYLDAADVLDTLPQPSQRGARRVAGVDLAKVRMRAVSAAVLALAPNPNGFTIAELAGQTRRLLPDQPYGVRHAADDLTKLRSKALVERLGTSRRYRPGAAGLRTLAGLLILREKVIKPVVAAAGRPRMGRPPKHIHPLDQHYENLQRELRRTFETLKLAA